MLAGTPFRPVPGRWRGRAPGIRRRAAGQEHRIAATAEQLAPSGRPAEVLDRLAKILPPIVVLGGAAGFFALLGLHLDGGGRLDLPWAPQLGLRLSFELDGLGALYAMLATGVGTLVAGYSAGYLPRHLDHQERSRAEAPSFYGLLALFMVAMVALATADDLVVLFVAWDLTALCSYFLIAYDRHEDASRIGALTALLVTGVSALLLLAAAVLLASTTGTFALGEAVAGASGRTATLAAVLVAVAALAKSAQVPLHFWLPRAMSAPTPVSAFLHSAALVAAGVFVLSRLHELLDRGGVLWILVVAGGLSILVGSVMALAARELKPVLAYSTISQYGFVTLLLGLGTEAAAAGAAVWVLAHGLAKSALFLTAGSVTEATGGETELARLGGLGRRLPWLATGSALAAASLAGLPLTAGFFKDELLFKAAVEAGPLAVAGLTGAVALTLAYTVRLWFGVFGGRPRADDVEVEPLAPALVVPVVFLGLLGVVGGIVAGPIERLAGDAAGDTLRVPATAELAYHLDLRAENLMTLSAWALAALLVLARAPLGRLAGLASRAGRLGGPERWFGATLWGLERLSRTSQRLETRRLGPRLAMILVPASLAVFAAVLATPIQGGFRLGSVSSADLPLAVTLVLVSGAALAATVPRDHLRLVLVTSGAGLSLTAAYAAFGGPDVAIVAGLVELVLSLVVVAIFFRIPRDVLRHAAERVPGRARRLRNVAIGVVAGLGAFVVTWSSLSRPTREEPAADRIQALTEDAHAKDTVTAILADFRGLDTLVEITVIGVALLGVLTYLRRRES